VGGGSQVVDEERLRQVIWHGGCEAQRPAVEVELPLQGAPALEVGSVYALGGHAA
jgi:hypothetical protein